jgi:hypothetical protein
MKCPFSPFAETNAAPKQARRQVLQTENSLRTRTENQKAFSASGEMHGLILGAEKRNERERLPRLPEFTPVREKRQRKFI